MTPRRCLFISNHGCAYVAQSVSKYLEVSSSYVDMLFIVTMAVLLYLRCVFIVSKRVLRVSIIDLNIVLETGSINTSL